MNGYQVIGHYKSLAPEHCTSRTLSDGKTFLQRAAAEQFARAEMHPGYSIQERENITHYWDPARGQHYDFRRQEWI